MKVVKINAKNNQTVMEHPAPLALAEAVVIEEGEIGIVYINDELVQLGVTFHGTPILLPGRYESIMARKQFPTQYRISSMRSNTDFGNMETPVTVGKVVIGKLA